MRRSRVATSFVSGFVLLLLTALPASATPGDLDPAFSNDGKVRTDVSNSHGIVDIAFQPNGKLLALGDLGNRFLVIQYRPDGSKDTSFGGGDGMVSIAFGNPTSTEPGGIAVSPVDLSIVVAGRASFSNGNEVMAVARLTPAGVLDDTFSGNGKAFASDGDSGANDVLVEPDGSVVAAGFAGADLGVARFLPTGQHDPGFGNQGFVHTHLGLNEEGFAVAEDSIGRIVVAGRQLDASNPENRHSDFLVARYTTAGHLDDTFSTNGLRLSDFLARDQANDVAVLPDDRIVVIGTAEGAGRTLFALAKYETNGDNYAPFGGGDGKVVTQIGTVPHTQSAAEGVAVQSDGKLVVAGSLFNGNTDRRFFALARYTKTGALDATFSGDGKLATAFHFDAEARAVGIDPKNGRIVAGGAEIPSATQSDPWVLARYLAA